MKDREYRLLTNEVIPGKGCRGIHMVAINNNLRVTLGAACKRVEFFIRNYLVVEIGVINLLISN